MKTAVLVHGYHLGTSNWDDVVWGNPAQDVYGRVPTGLREALRLNADVIFFPTGASSQDGLLEGEYALKMARDRILEVPEFAEWDQAKALAWLEERAVLELKSVSTHEEVVICAQMALDRGIERFVIVSSPTHIMRCHKLAVSEFSNNPAYHKYLHALYAVASDVSYTDSTVNDVLIVEPPHRPDRHAVPIHKTLARALRHVDDPERALELDKKLNATFDDFEDRLQ